jgi:SAM-dependent methyltransferase
MGAEWLMAWHRENGAPVLGKGPALVPPAAGGESMGVDWSLLTLLLSLEGRSPIVALGSDLAGLSVTLSGVGVPIITLDYNYERIRLLERQRIRSGLTNVLPVCGGTTGCLPFRDGSVGMTIVNLVGHRLRRQDDGGPVEIQADFLLEARRILKAGGIVCLVVNQRHGHISSSESRALLSRCGFPDGESYMAFPGRHRFTALAPMVAGRAMFPCIDLFVEGNAFRERRRRAWLKILAMSGLLPHFALGNIVVGRKEE